MFNDEYDSIFIPAGRSVITLLTSQLNYIFASMDDEQKRSIDYCTQKYIEYILKIKPLFSNGFMKFDYFADETGKMDKISSKDSLISGTAFKKTTILSQNSNTKIHASGSVKYDLIGKLVSETGLTRKNIVEILTGIENGIFDQFKDNPEEFIIKTAQLINDEKATAVIEHITYNVLDERYGTDIFTEPIIKGKLNVNAMKAEKHIYDHIVYDFENERKCANEEELDIDTEVAVYVKLPV